MTMILRPDIPLPKIPDDIQEPMKQYLFDLHQVLTQFNQSVYETYRETIPDSENFVESIKDVAAASSLKGDVTLTGGTAITLTQAGQDITVDRDAAVDSIAKSGSAALTGAVTLSEGTSIGLTQAGQDIAIAFTGSSKFRQMVSISTGAMSTLTATIPNDNTTPQSSEGVELITVSITPEDTANKLIILAHTNVMNASGPSNACAMALFQDSTADALAASMTGAVVNTINTGMDILYTMTAGTTSATTFKLRVGAIAGGTVTINGVDGVQRFNGVNLSYLVIMEVEP